MAETFEIAYLIVSGTTTASRVPDIARGLRGLGYTRVIVIPTPNSARVLGFHWIESEGVQVVESYFDSAIRPRPPRGALLFAPCGFNSLNKLAHGIADTLALSVVAEAIGRRTPVVVAPSLNQPLMDHPMARASLRTLPDWGVTIIAPVDDGAGPRLAPDSALMAAMAPHARQVPR